MDFIDLNKACLKNSYLFSQIDKLVNETFGFQLLSFLDAFFGYHRSIIHPFDEEKTSFISKRGNYHYRVMPFILKNAATKHQMIVNKVFKDLLGNTMEDYVDYMIVKS